MFARWHVGNLVITASLQWQSYIVSLIVVIDGQLGWAKWAARSPARKSTAQVRPGTIVIVPGPARHDQVAVFLFFYFLFLFFTKIYFRFQNLQEYTPAAPLPGGRDLVAPLRGGRDFTAKIFAETPGGPVAQQRSGRPPRPPGSGEEGPGRPAAGRPPPRGSRPSFTSPKIQKKILGLS